MSEAPETPTGLPLFADELLPIVYEQLRRRARAQLAREGPGQTLQATSLVHEAYLRIVGDRETGWENEAQFFAAAVQAMRRILIERARNQGRRRERSARIAIPLDALEAGTITDPHELLALDEALNQLAKVDARSADLVRLRFYTGVSTGDAARILGISERTARREWNYARAWLLRRLHQQD